MIPVYILRKGDLPGCRAALLRVRSRDWRRTTRTRGPKRQRLGRIPLHRNFIPKYSTALAQRCSKWCNLNLCLTPSCGTPVQVQVTLLLSPRVPGASSCIHAHNT